MASVNAYASETTIFVTWGNPAPVPVERSEDGGQTWTAIRAAVSGGRFADTEVTPGVRYRYRVGGMVSAEAWVPVLWGWNTVTQVWTANDLVNRPTFRARILDASRRIALSPALVTSVECSVLTVSDSDINWRPRYDLIAGPQTIAPEDCLLPNLIVDRIWRDSTGFNFRHTPEIDLEPGTYAVRYRMVTAGEPILLSFLYDNTQRRRCNG